MSLEGGPTEEEEEGGVSIKSSPPPPPTLHIPHCRVEEGPPPAASTE